jgi:DNA polymerase III alpha subunit (gram-positive type)
MAEMVAFDFETTGLSPGRHHVIEIGAVRFDLEGRVLDTYAQLCDPGYPLPDEIVTLTGIRAEEIAGCPRPFEALSNFLHWAGPHAVFAAHNAGFDVRFLNAAFLANHEFAPALPLVDTLRWARSLNLPVSDCKLKTLLRHYGIGCEGLHRSLADAHGVRQLVARWLSDVPEPRAEVVSRLDRPRRPAPASSFPEY